MKIYVACVFPPMNPAEQKIAFERYARWREALLKHHEILRIPDDSSKNTEELIREAEVVAAFIVPPQFLGFGSFLDQAEKFGKKTVAFFLNRGVMMSMRSGCNQFQVLPDTMLELFSESDLAHLAATIDLFETASVALQPA